MDFKVYIVGQEFQMAYIDTQIPYDINVSEKYLI